MNSSPHVWLPTNTIISRSYKGNTSMHRRRVTKAHSLFYEYSRLSMGRLIRFLLRCDGGLLNNSLSLESGNPGVITELGSTPQLALSGFGSQYKIKKSLPPESQVLCGAHYRASCMIVTQSITSHFHIRLARLSSLFASGFYGQ